MSKFIKSVGEKVSHWFETNESTDVEIAVEKMDERKKIAQEVRDAMEDLKHDQTKFEKKIDERKKIVEAVEDATEALKQDRKEFESSNVVKRNNFFGLSKPTREEVLAQKNAEARNSIPDKYSRAADDVGDLSCNTIDDFGRDWEDDTKDGVKKSAKQCKTINNAVR